MVLSHLFWFVLFTQTCTRNLIPVKGRGAVIPAFVLFSSIGTNTDWLVPFRAFVVLTLAASFIVVDGRIPSVLRLLYSAADHIEPFVDFDS
jgi:hypothetical protein